MRRCHWSFSGQLTVVVGRGFIALPFKVIYNVKSLNYDCLQNGTADSLLQFQFHIIPFIAPHIEDSAVFEDEVLCLDPFKGT